MNKEHKREYNLKYVAENKVKVKAYAKQYRETHPKLKRPRNIKWWELSPEEKIAWSEREPKKNGRTLKKVKTPLKTARKPLINLDKLLKKVYKPLKKTFSNHGKPEYPVKIEPNLGFLPQLSLLDIDRIKSISIQSEPDLGFFPQLPYVAIERVKRSSFK